MKTPTRLLSICATLCLILTATALAQYEISWRTVDGGGGMFSTGGTFSLGGTIGQPDAGVMAGGQFQLVGGFWAAQTATCTCPGDMNGDGTRNGMDVQQFVGCILGSGTCGCADLNGAGGVDVNDVQIFVQDLLTAQDCP